MSSHFQPKSLLFYGVMIGSVTILFRLTSAYGERHLKAPPNVNGHYLINEPLVGCPEGDYPKGETASHRLVLVIQQSGVYLNGTLTLVEAESDTSQENASLGKQPSLTGRWQEGQITLSGTADLAECQLGAQDSTNSAIPLTVAGSLIGEPVTELTGQLTLGSTELTFTAEREVIETTLEGH
ncbi:hypothetical protein H6G89_04885 [Oscillatoria sp. FACHB-1407]|uniref:hypothetical protein n=1 Tax=Oscillatoria sp. FACHB-1407 TaxID=2692847 RepID=UPI001683DFAF|nr:hypothetical protein [Oscillatoria sp. FACHB-1407]MBD2460373.1 hypothetical protein [Oscillatoria sp. FACHB-1407]